MRTFSKPDGSMYQFRPVVGGGYRMIFWAADNRVITEHLSDTLAEQFMIGLINEPDWSELTHD